MLKQSPESPTALTVTQSSSLLFEWRCIQGWQNVWCRVGGHTSTHTHPHSEPQNDLFVSMCDLRLSISANLWGNEACRRVPSEQRLDATPAYPSTQWKCVSVHACEYVCRRGGAWKKGKATVNLKQVPRKSGWLWSWLDIVAKLWNYNITWTWWGPKRPNHVRTSRETVNTFF